MRKKLYLFMFLILLFGVTFTGYMSYSFTKNIILDNVKDSLKSDARLIKDYFIDLSENKNYDSTAKELKSSIGKRVTIIRQDGKVIGESDVSSEKLENHLNRPEVKAALYNEEGMSIRYSSTEKIYMYYYALKYTANNQSYIIRLAMPLYNIDYVQKHIIKLIIFTVIFGLLFCSLLGFIYINRFTRPIIQMTKIATGIALGQYEKRINLSSKDEIGELGHAFNLMADRLQETINDLSDKKNKLESILTSMEDGVIVVDNNEKILLMNPAAKKFFSISEEVEGKHFIEVIRNTEIENIINYDVDTENEVVINNPNPMYFRVKTVKVINYEKNKENIGLCLVIQNITKIRALEKMRSDFVANVSHELRTPLTSIKGFAETLKFVEDKNTRDKFLDIIYVESERLTRLINDILTLSELENKDYSANFEKININESLEEIYSIMEPAARNKGIKLIYEKYDKSLYIYGDRDKFKQMFINLIDNAIKYTPKDGKVEIIISLDNHMSRIDIKDNGIGISKEHISRLFERFYRVDKARSRSVGGTGLGLAIVKHILTIFNGSIDVKSESGKGTTFSVYLPCIDVKEV
ncbi:PAS/PAC sensor signal transduction histidine kinase [Caloramator quimbayensis]|uniref:Phosphate regulon sensor protein PhoR n=1 Tax=Caloramator quimbayensis TaxID=1147123 RepID=A0A1T4X1R8_9CLOT|nr:phosphate regulon sensor histidine kinase PhoR [Caloramator quimbayensis]SKA83544.1 PAS/PAC sensor signal transduction histidine kinase [Caloramator quimbayensis]